MTKTNPTIFIVDDEPLLSEMLTDYLKEQYEGFNLKSFPTGEACLQSLDEQPDAVVLDYYLNSKEKNAANGIDILKEIKKRNKAITGHHAFQSEKLCYSLTNHHVWCYALCDKRPGCFRRDFPTD